MSIDKKVKKCINVDCYKRYFTEHVLDTLKVGRQGIGCIPLNISIFTVGWVNHSFVPKKLYICIRCGKVFKYRDEPCLRYKRHKY